MTPLSCARRIDIFPDPRQSCRQGSSARDHLKGLRELHDDYPEVQGRIVVSLEVISRRTDDGIEILSVADFIRQLWDNEILNSK